MACFLVASAAGVGTLATFDWLAAGVSAAAVAVVGGTGCARPAARAREGVTVS